jgi:multimeric flavodoxin WrbA
MMKKALGLSYGRPMGNSEVLIKEALMGIQEVTEAEVDLIRILDLTIKPCTGCESCMISNLKGESGSCHLKGDHMPFLLDKIAENDGIIIGAPAYNLMPPGLLIVIVNRMLGSGRAFREKCEKRPKVGGVITLGGTDWTNLVLPISVRGLFGRAKFIDQMLVEYVPRPGQVVLREEALARARKLGRNVGEAMKMPINKVKYVGDEEETCPVCHSNLISVRGKEVECPICDIRGKIDISGKKIKVIFEESELQKTRFSPWGTKRHDDAITKGHKIFDENRDLVREKLEKYRTYGSVSKPPPLDKIKECRI